MINDSIAMKLDNVRDLLVLTTRKYEGQPSRPRSPATAESSVPISMLISKSSLSSGGKADDIFGMKTNSLDDKTDREINPPGQTQNHGNVNIHDQRSIRDQTAEDAHRSNEIIIAGHLSHTYRSIGLPSVVPRDGMPHDQGKPPAEDDI